MLSATQTEYNRAVEHLLALGHELHATPAHKFDLANMRALLEAMGHPQRRFASVLIAGTNGKGSTAALLHSILIAAGHKAALYTSPHLIRVNERIRTADGEISDPEFAEIHRRVEDCVQRLLSEGRIPWHPSFFEMLTAMAFEYFASTGVEIAVLEVGMGGRLDATNVVEPMLSVVTDIALDHQAFLGNTIAEIAAEKAGIIRPNGVVVSLAQHPEATDVLGKVILERKARAVDAAKYVASEPELSADEQPALCYSLEVLGEQIEIVSPLVGRHQLRNLALAIAAAVELNQLGFRVTAKNIESGIRNVRWPARFQILPATKNRPEMILDVAHNPAGAWALRAALSQLYSGRPLLLIFGAMRDKAIAEMSEILFPLFDCVIATHAQSPRAASPEEIRQAASRTGMKVIAEENARAALIRAQAMAAVRSRPAIVISGSIYLVGEVLSMLQSSASL